MKRTMLDIIDAICFLIALSLTFKILIYFEITFSALYVVAGVLLVWIVVKMLLRRFINNRE